MSLPDKSTRDPSFAPRAILMALGNTPDQIASAFASVDMGTIDALIGQVMIAGMDAYQAHSANDLDKLESKLKQTTTNAAVALHAVSILKSETSGSSAENFLEQGCRKAPETLSVKFQDFYRLYHEWCSIQSYRPISQASIGQVIRASGFKILPRSKPEGGHENHIIGITFTKLQPDATDRAAS